MKEKYELSLDSRQVVTLTVAALAVVGGVFVLGVVVGKRMATEQQPKDKGDLLSTLDQKTQALDSVQHDASLTFQEELTKKPDPVAKAPEPVKPVEAKKPDAPKLEEKKVADAPKPDEAKPAEPKIAEAPKPAEPKPEGGTDAKTLQAAIAKASEPPHLQETVKEEPIATRTRDGGALKEAFGKVQKAPEPLADSPWSLQMASYQDKAEAERFAAGLRDKGYAPFVVSADVAGKGTWYRVKVGRFSTKEAASRYLADFKRETQMNAIVTGK
jgi:cell division protein FtsN